MIGAADIPWADWPGRLWGFGLEFEPEVDLPVRALLDDGLRVPPFDRHPPGRELLQAAGLTAGGWEAWFQRVVDHQVHLRAELTWPAWQRSGQSLTREAVREPVLPRWSAADLWEGPVEVVPALGRLPPPLPVATPRIDPGPLWRVAAPFRGRVPHFWIFVVHYPGLVYKAIPPAAVVIGDRTAANPPILRGMLERALKELAAG